VFLPSDRSVGDLPGGHLSQGSQRDRRFSFCGGLAELNWQAWVCNFDFLSKRLVLKRAREY